VSRTDERIREDLHTLTRPVELDGVLDRVARRKARRRIRRRAEHVILAIVVLGGSLTATLVLTRAFGHRSVTSPGGGPTANPDGGGGRFDMECDDSQIHVDVDGDGQPDQVDVASSATSPDGSCVHSDAGRRYVLHVSGGKYTNESPQPQPTPFLRTRFYGISQALPECQQPFDCRLFSAADLNGDGVREIAVQDASEGPIRSLVLYRVDVSPATPPVQRANLTRLAVAGPGDPWSERYGIPPGPATLYWGASAEVLRSISCTDWEGAPVVLVTTALPANGGGYEVHRTFLRLDADQLTVVESSDEIVQEAPSLPADLCGAHIWQPGDNPRA
jgi:hypothetical protein